MERLTNYLELHNGILNAALASCLLVASVALYFPIGFSFFLVGNPPNPLLDRLLPVSCIAIMAIFDLGSAWLLQRSRQQTFWSAFGLSLAVTLGGAFLVGVILFSIASLNKPVERWLL